MSNKQREVDQAEHESHGGSYLVDPKTGKRTLVERTETPQPHAPESAPNQAKKAAKE